jgi:flagellar basal-body rod protein FlgC
MDFLTSINISSSGLSVQRLRMEALASNLANVETTRTPEGGPYRRKDVVVSALPLTDDFASLLKTELGENLQRALATGIIEDSGDPRKVFNPTHPDADGEGNVAMPNIDLVEEMVNLVTATRSYEANVTAINAAKSMALRAIELGR